ncbi:MAG: hypothetical protein N5P05_000837 [Chroococcopsis gigantea SAG 12.99]|jgi:ATP adenylyltransferase|nr:phosphorylase [Chlorogloea purpurea SAG 13.99]MDV2999231.1 hypothetical protein [Chroococcopsis gigantea SAG 12.99]
MSLWSKVIHRTERAIACGALHSIPTSYEFIAQDGINFLVRIVTNLARKAEDKQKTKPSTNPFLPYDENLYVADLPPSHICLLNKFNVVENHLLIITRDYQDQEDWLTLEDFQALWTCLQEIDGLGFYNGGEAAGSSQPHKHLQLVPFPFIPEIKTVPIETVIEFPHITLPYIHACEKLSIDPNLCLEEVARIYLQCYDTLLQRVGLTKVGQKQTGAYNLLTTRRWMMLIPRSQESYQSIAVNSLGFAGALLVRDREQLQLLKQLTPMEILKNTAHSKN